MKANQKQMNGKPYKTGSLGAYTLDLERRNSREKSYARVLSFTSGKGGVGKTHTAANVGIALSTLGKSVLLLDADLGLANLNVLLGLKPRATLHDVLKGKLTIDDIILTGPGGIALIPAASGIEEIGVLSLEERMILLNQIESIAHRYDYLLLDTQAGIGSDVMYFNSASSEIVCVVTPEPTSMTDTYALIKVLSQSYSEKEFHVVVNQATSEQEALHSYSKLANVVQQFLNADIKYLGWVPSDKTARQCVMDQKSVVLEFPSSAVARGLTSIADRIEQSSMGLRVKGGLQFFFKQLLEVDSYGSEAII